MSRHESFESFSIEKEVLLCVTSFISYSIFVVSMCVLLCVSASQGALSRGGGALQRRQLHAQHDQGRPGSGCTELPRSAKGFLSWLVKRGPCRDLDLVPTEASPVVTTLYFARRSAIYNGFVLGQCKCTFKLSDWLSRGK